MNRTSRRCANQNKLKHCHEHYKRGRTSRGCANRNVRPVVSKTALASSHPTRVCESESGSGWMYRLCSMRARESKCSEGRRAYDDLLSHLTRVRESKPGRSFGPLQSGQSYPALVRESKPLRRLRKVVIYPSHPSRVRESKCGKCDYLGNPNVAPHAGARIEITIKRPLWQKSHPNMGVGIEIPESRL